MNECDTIKCYCYERERNYTEKNARAIDRRAARGWEYAVPISRETFAQAKNGQRSVVLTPTIPVPAESEKITRSTSPRGQSSHKPARRFRHAKSHRY